MAAHSGRANRAMEWVGLAGWRRKCIGVDPTPPVDVRGSLNVPPLPKRVDRTSPYTLQARPDVPGVVLGHRLGTTNTEVNSATRCRSGHGGPGHDCCWHDCSGTGARDRGSHPRVYRCGRWPVYRGDALPAHRGKYIFGVFRAPSIQS